LQQEVRMKDKFSLWQVYEYKEQDINKIIHEGFNVWFWENTDRYTIEGTKERLTYLFLKHNIHCRFVETPFPNPKFNSLAKRITQ
jgi:hypothetical protein